MSDNIHELARTGDINAIATLVGQAINLAVEPKLQYGLVLVLKVKSADPKICSTIIQTLVEIQPKIQSIQVSGTNWNKFFVLKEGKYVENTSTVTATGLIAFLLIGCCVALVNLFYKPDVPVTSAEPLSSRTFVGISSTGHQLYLDGTCVIIKGVTTSEIQALNTDINGFKKIIKQETGKQCALLE